MEVNDSGYFIGKGCYKFILFLHTCLDDTSNSTFEAVNGLAEKLKPTSSTDIFQDFKEALNIFTKCWVVKTAPHPPQ